MGTGPVGGGISLLSPHTLFCTDGHNYNKCTTNLPPPRIRILVFENKFSFSFLSCQDFWKSLPLFPHPILICFRRLCKTGVIIH